METFELVPLHNGVISLRSRLNRETFHPGVGPAEEARILHVEQQKLVGRAQATADFQLWDVGLGAAANAIAAIRALQKSAPRQDPGNITLHSFDKSTAPLRFALGHAHELGYIVGFEDHITQLLREGEVRIDNHVVWKLHVGDFCAELANFPLPSPDSIFYDPYSAKSNGEMWTLDHFARLYARLDPTRSCLLTNYTVSTHARVTLLLAGFAVGRGCQVHKKLETTIASNQLSELEHPLDRDWLENRVRVSHSAAPMRSLPYAVAPISREDFERLQALPQFA